VTGPLEKIVESFQKGKISTYAQNIIYVGAIGRMITMEGKMSQCSLNKLEEIR
jgi:hypothetical protein